MADPVHSEAHGAHPETGHEGTESHGGVFPPFNAETFAPQLVWLALSFIVLYILMSRVALPKIGRVLEQRRDRIADDLDTAASFKDDADKALQAYESELNAAKARAQAIANDMREKLKNETDRLKADLDGKLARELEAADARITATKNAALANLRTVSAEVASVVVGHLLGEQPPTPVVEQAVDAVLAGR